MKRARSIFGVLSLLIALLWAGTFSALGHIVDADPNEFPKLRNPVDIVITPDGSRAVVVCHNNSIAVIDLNSGKYEIQNIPASRWPGQHPRRAIFIGNDCYVVNEYSDFVTQFDPYTLRIVANHAVPIYSEDLLYDPARDRIYVTNRWLDAVLVYDRNFQQIGSAIAVGRNPGPMALDNDGRLYVGNFGSWDVSVVDVDAGEVVATHYLGSGPTGLVAVGNEIAVTNRGGRQLQRINGAPLIENDQTDIVNMVTFIDRQTGAMRDKFLDQGGDYMRLVGGSGLLVFTGGGTGTVHIAESNPVGNLQTLDLLADEWGLPGGRAGSGLRIVSHTVGAAIKDNRTVYAINYFRDSVVEIKFNREHNAFIVRREIPINELGKVITAFQGGHTGVNMNARQNGERYFKTIAAWARGQRDLTCSTCHPDGHSDFRFILDKNPDPFEAGKIQGPEKHPSALAVNMTAPYAWEGSAQSLFDFNMSALQNHDIQNGKQDVHNDVAQFQQIFEQLLRPEPNPYPRPNGNPDNPNAPERGKAVFIRAGCLSCHNGMAFTDNAMHDVGTGRMLNTPSLLQLWDKAPYLHDGRAQTLADVLDPAIYARSDVHGAISTLSASEKDDLVAFLNAIIPEDISTSVNVGNAQPETITLAQNYPNPFNPETTIWFRLSRPGHVALTVYDAAGQLVRRLVQGDRAAGEYTVSWDGRNQDGMQAATGVYLYRLVAGEFVQTRKMLLIR